MALTDMMLAVLEQSGLLALWQAAAPWLALDERQLIFVVATPVFVAVTLWEYLKIHHDPRLMDTREAMRNFALGAGYQITELLFAGQVLGTRNFRYLEPITMVGALYFAISYPSSLIVRQLEARYARAA